jgi:DNA invertase Pin-like site-specific DNA recombinase
MAKDHEVGIYVRLSQEDSRAGESVSVENQKLMLTKHVKEMGWILKEVYCDDGFSGTNQNRPAFQRMMADVKQGFINTILIKDLSRLGRNYLEVGNLAEIFLPEHGCELISLNEKIDEMMFLRNWFNEQYCSSTSKKVRAAKKICAENGKYLGSYAPYGYRKNPENKHKLIIDEDTASIVRKMYELRAQGKGYKAIAGCLNETGIPAPRDYYYQQKDEVNPTRSNHLWNDRTVMFILKSEMYIGNIVQGKIGTVSYKNSKIVSKPKEDWIIAEGMHEPIIDLDLWETVQSIGQRRYQPRVKSDGTFSIFSGLLVCADCGFKMRSHTKRHTRKDGSLYERATFICGSYARSGKTACTTHFIDENSLKELVADQIREHAKLVKHDEKRIVAHILRLQNDEATTSRAAYENELKSHNSRLAMLEKIIAKLYEDRVTGAVPDATFKTLIHKYEQERFERQQSVTTLQDRITSIRRDNDNAAAWARLIKQYANLEVLSAEAMLALIDNIVIGEVKSANDRQIRDIKIIYKYIGDADMLSADIGEAVTEYERQVV